MQVKWDAGERFESMHHALHRPDVRLLPRPSPTQQPAKKKQTEPREAEGKPKAGKPKGVAKPGRTKQAAAMIQEA